MFSYSDPGKTLKPAKALANYRMRLHMQYLLSAKTPKSAFTLLEAFGEVPPAKADTAAVEWSAFPRSAQSTNEEIDASQFRLQDEYVEWRVEKAAGMVKRITFTTEFATYYEALAMVGPNELVAAIKVVIPGAAPKAADLFGPGFTPGTASAEARAAKFIAFRQQNPWINGRKGILCLGHGSNTLEALFDLVTRAAIPNPAVLPGSICGTLNGSCVPGRNSDPSIATAVQTLARSGRSLSLADPVGIEIRRLGGIWRVKDKVVDINNPAANQGIWTVSRTGRRAVLTVGPNLRLDDSSITSGAQVASVLRVRASAVSAAEADLPDWARMGQENSQRLDEAAGGGV